MTVEVKDIIDIAIEVAEVDANSVALAKNCGREGHKVKDCWELESKKHEHPKGWKSIKNTTIDENEETGNFVAEMIMAIVDEDLNEYKNIEETTYYIDDVSPFQINIQYLLSPPFIADRFGKSQKARKRRTPDPVKRAVLAKGSSEPPHLSDVLFSHKTHTHKI